MSNQLEHKNQSEEIDLGYLIHKINQLFRSAVVALFEIITFFLKYKFIVLALIIIGVAYGYYKDATSKPVFNNEAIVIPNFESVDYLYDKVNALNAKIASKDSVFLKQIVDTNYRKLRKIELEPIVDLYNFISKSRENIDIFRIFTQSQEIQEYMEEFANSKYYKYHRINFKLLGDLNNEYVVNQILNYLNENNHFNNYKQVFVDNKQWQINEQKKMVAQIDSLLASVSFGKNPPPNQGVLINDNANLHSLIERKRLLIEENIKLDLQKLDYDNVIKLVHVDYNVIPEEEMQIPNKIKYPIYLILLFSLFFLIRHFYIKIKEIAKRESMTKG